MLKFVRKLLSSKNAFTKPDKGTGPPLPKYRRKVSDDYATANEPIFVNRLGGTRVYEGIHLKTGQEVILNDLSHQGRDQRV